MKNAFLNQLGEYFNTFLPDIKRASKNTIESYEDSFVVFFQFMYETKELSHAKITYKKLTPALFDEFIIWMMKNRQYSEASVCQRMSAIVSFLKYASRRNMTALSAYTSATAVGRPTTSQVGFPYFTLEETKAILASPDPNKYLGDRNLALLSLLYETGARAQEICDLCVGSIRFGNPTKIKIIGKRNKVREVPISEDVVGLLKWYLKRRNLHGRDNRNKPLFSSQTNNVMTTSCVRSIVEKYVNLAIEANPTLFPEKKYSPHSFRHSKAVHMAEAGVNLIYIRNFLGHATVGSTEIYARVGQEAVTKALTERRIPRISNAVLQLEKSKFTLPDFLSR